MLDTMIPVFLQMLVLFLIMGLGYVGGKTKVMSLEGNKALSSLVNNITNPCTILYSSLCSQRTLANSQVFQLIGIAFVMYLAMIGLAHFLPNLLRAPKEQWGQYRFMLVFSNVSYMGIPVISAIFGQTATFCAAVFVMVFYVFIYTYGIFMICGDRGTSRFHWKLLCSPMLICSVISIICYLLGIRAEGVLESTLNMVRGITTPCAMLIIGCALSAIPLRKVLTNWRLYIVSFLKLFAIPFCAYLLLKPFVSDHTILGVTVILMAMPVASNFTMLSAQYNRDQALAASSVFITTLVSILTIPLLAGLLIGPA